MKLRLALELLGSIIVGFIADFIIKNNETSFIIGVLTFLVTETVLANYYLQRVSKTAEIITAILNSFDEKNEFSNIYITELLLYFKRTSKNIKNGIVDILTEDVPNLWIRSLRNFEYSMWATSFISLKHGWDRGFTLRGYEIQRDQIRKGKAIRRIFVVEDEKELEYIDRIMHEQSEIGIHTKYIYLKELVEIPSVQTFFSILQSYDFAIYDNRYLSVIFLDQRRNFKGAKLINNLEMLDAAKNLYLLMWDDAHEKFALVNK